MKPKNSLNPLKKDIGKRIDLVLLEEFNTFTRTSLKNLIIKGIFKVNGQNIMPNYRLNKEDTIEWDSLIVDGKNEFIEDTFIIKPKFVQFDVIYEDEFILVVNKPSGINVHPVKRNDTTSLLNGIYHYIKYTSKFDKNVKPRQVHRLDQGTSGVLLVAKTPQAHYFYSKLFEERRVHKEYIAIVSGDFEEAMVKSRSNEIRLTSNLLKNEELKKVTSSTSVKAKFSETIVSFIEHFNKFGKKKFSRVLCIPKTGRTHQIRVHLSQFGFPILGDTLYGGQKYKRLMLHAHALEIPLMDLSKEIKRFEATIPEKFENLSAESKLDIPSEWQI